MAGFLTTVLVLAGTVLGVTIAFSLEMQFREVVEEVIDFGDPRIVLGLLFGGVGYLVASTIAFEFRQWFEKKLPTIKITDFVWGTIGLGVGLLLANLIMLPFLVIVTTRNLGAFFGTNPVLAVTLPVLVIVLPLLVNVCLGYIGMTVFVRKQYELMSFLSGRGNRSVSPGADLKIIDTSVVIDGRIVDLLPTGAIEGRLCVPVFVMNELQLLADSSDGARRSRGKRGFEILDKLKRQDHLPLELPAVDYHDIDQVDAKLIEYARETGGTIVTNDFALNKLARLQEIRVINVNEISNALRPVVLSGEIMEIRLVKEGTSAGQGVGYLNDGTMVVVEKAASAVGTSRRVKVASVQQSSVGRMVFANLVEMASG